MRGWGALARWAPFFNDQGKPLADWSPGAGVGTGSGSNVEPTAATVLTSSSVVGDTNDRFQLLADGTMKWGPGSSGQDVSLSRTAAQQLTIQTGFLVGPGGLYAGNTPTAVLNALLGAQSKQTTAPVAVFMAAASQTADLLDLLASDGTTKLAHVDSGGSFFAANDIWATGRLLTADGRGVLTDQVQGFSGTGLLLSGQVGIGGKSFGSATGTVLFIANDTADPSTNPAGGGIIYVSGGTLKYRGSAGTVTTLAAA